MFSEQDRYFSLTSGMVASVVVMVLIGYMQLFK